MKKMIIIVVSLFYMISIYHCKGKKLELSPDIASSDEALYKLGEEYLKRDAEKARLYMRQVIDSFPKSFYAQRAKLAIADSYFHKGDEGSLILAAAEYREFISLYPYSPYSAYAQHQVGMTFYKKTFSPGRDQTKTWQALAEFKKVITNYPLSEEAKLAQEKIKECEEKLADHTFGIGKHYYQVYAFKASTSRLSEILTSFPNYSKMEKVYYYLGDSYFKWGKPDQAVPYFTKLITDYPQSKYVQKAQKRMETINKNQGGEKKEKS